ncbi:zinc fyve domain containing protein [Ophiostoma piceae UAMH 11346]|uniref:Zinc fyve domain containing protein n=1 Tax=Ophiostoma piceae (strain UAMH 11346) TaxID=1262450 RepID=S3CJR5_OPHP1|nr:zinc fyve domain containing protein [Ophiostoma piceae UAMH 11346]
MADDNLLDRLNALKPTGISIKQPASTLSVIDRPPASREDDLTSRLKSLRIAKEASGDKSETEAESKHPVLPSGNRSSSKPYVYPEDADEDGLFANDAAVNDLLMEMAAEQGLGDEDVEAVEHDSDDLLPLPDVPSTDWLKMEEGGDDDSDNEEHAKQVEELLQKLAGTPLKGGQIVHEKKKEKRKDEDADDSDGEIMEEEIRRVLDRAKDEAILDDSDAKHTRNDGEVPDDGNGLGLPSVPTSFADIDDNELRLPSAPTQDLPERGGDDDISQRLAGLRGLSGKAAGLGDTDSFGLPSAPTFKPGDEGGVLKRGHYGFGRANYTDEDQQTWCIVCLEDATIRCVGCAEDRGSRGANNAYCEGCWQDMHVGPAAGFDERGHMRVPLKKVPWP